MPNASRTVVALFTGVLLAACAESPAPLQPALDPAPSTAASPAPLALRAVTTGSANACGLTGSRQAYCWGEGLAGQLGTGSDESTLSPAAVAGGTRFASIHSAGDFSCGLAGGGQAHCWGRNDFGQFGNGTTVGSSAPTLAAGGMRFRELTVGVYHACGLTPRGEVYCWGANGADGVTGSALGAPSAEHCANPFPGYRGASWPCSTTPVPVSGGLRFRSISAGLWYTCGLTDSGTAHCWGWNHFHQLGDGTVAGRTEPTPVATTHTFQSLSTGVAHACGITGTGEALCWGARFFAFGSLGNGSEGGSALPTPVSGGHRFVSISPSRANNIYMFTCGVTDQGQALCWGGNRYGQLGTTTELPACTSGSQSVPCATTPTPVAGELRWNGIAAGSEFTCATTRGGQAYCWGRNDSGQLGNGTRENASVPSPVGAP